MLFTSLSGVLLFLLCLSSIWWSNSMLIVAICAIVSFLILHIYSMVSLILSCFLTMLLILVVYKTRKKDNIKILCLSVFITSLYFLPFSAKFLLYSYDSTPSFPSPGDSVQIKVYGDNIFDNYVYKVNVIDSAPQNSVVNINVDQPKHLQVKNTGKMYQKYKHTPFGKEKVGGAFEGQDIVSHAERGKIEFQISELAIPNSFIQLITKIDGNLKTYSIYYTMHPKLALILLIIGKSIIFILIIAGLYYCWFKFYD